MYIGDCFYHGDLACVVVFVGDPIQITDDAKAALFAFDEPGAFVKTYSQLSTCLCFSKDLFDPSKWESSVLSALEDSIGLKARKSTPFLSFCAIAPNYPPRLVSYGQNGWRKTVKDNHWTSAIRAVEQTGEFDKNRVVCTDPLSIRMIRDPAHANRLLYERTAHSRNVRSAAAAASSLMEFYPTTSASASTPGTLQIYKVNHSTRSDFRSVEIVWQMLISAIYAEKKIADFSDACVVVVDATSQAMLCNPRSLDGYALNRIVAAKSARAIADARDLSYVFVAWDAVSWSSWLLAVKPSKPGPSADYGSVLLASTYFPGLTKGVPMAVSELLAEILRKRWTNHAAVGVSVPILHKDTAHAFFKCYLDLDPAQSGAQIPTTDTAFGDAIDYRLRLYTMASSNRFNDRLGHFDQTRRSLSLETAADVFTDRASFHVMHRCLFSKDGLPWSLLYEWIRLEVDLFRKRLSFFSSDQRYELWRLLSPKDTGTLDLFYATDPKKTIDSVLLHVQKMLEIDGTDDTPTNCTEWVKQRTFVSRKKIHRRDASKRAVWCAFKDCDLGVLPRGVSRAKDMAWDINDYTIDCITACNEETSSMLMTEASFDFFLVELFKKNVLGPRSHMGARCECKSIAQDPSLKACPACAAVYETWNDNAWTSHLGRLGMSRLVEWSRQMITVSGSEAHPRFDLSANSSIVDMVRYSRMPPSHQIPTDDFLPPCIQAISKKLRDASGLSHPEKVALLAFNVSIQRDDVTSEAIAACGMEDVYTEQKRNLLAQLSYSRNKSIFGPFSHSGDASWNCSIMCTSGLCPVADDQRACQKKGFAEAARRHLMVEFEDEKNIESVKIIGAGKTLRTRDGFYAPADIAQPSDYSLGLLLLKFQKDHPTRTENNRTIFPFGREWNNDKRKAEEMMPSEEMPREAPPRAPPRKKHVAKKSVLIVPQKDRRRGPPLPKKGVALDEDPPVQPPRKKKKSSVVSSEHVYENEFILEEMKSALEMAEDI